MNTLTKNTKIAERQVFAWNYWMISLALFTGLILSILSWLELCVEHCSANQDYRLFGLPFAFVGMGFFTLGLGLHLLSRRYAILSSLLALMIAAALGSEIRFIAVQKFEIGHWCPVCLSIAVIVCIIQLLLAAGYIKQFKSVLKLDNRGQIMEIIRKGAASISFAFIGFILAFLGISKHNSAEAAINDIKDKMAFGNKNSQIEVYFVTDWFCPSCKKVEPLIEKIFPKILNKATFFFIDYPIHKKSLNYTPYNLAFIINDRQHYLKARNALIALTEEIESPNDEDMIELARKNHLNFQELSFVDVKSGMEFFDKIINKYNLNATPVIIVANKKNNKVIKLEGRDEITESQVMKAIDSMENAAK